MPLRALVVDDDPHIRKTLRFSLALEGIEVTTAQDGLQALDALRSDRPDVVVLDVMMPGMDGFQVVRALRGDPELAGTPVVMLSAKATEADHWSGWRAGVDSYLTKPFDMEQLLAEIFRVVSARPRRSGSAGRPADGGRDETGEQGSVPHEEAVLLTLLGAAALTDARDPGTRRHLERVAGYGLALASTVAPELVTDPGFLYGMLLHDIGKVALPRAIFEHPGPLTPREWFLVYTHPDEGARMVEAVPFLRAAIPVIRHHHERWDGLGYPEGVAGEAIPLAARIFAVCDAYDSMTSPRPYRDALTREEARAEIERCAGTQFDPALAHAFLALEPDLEPIVDGGHPPDEEILRLFGRLTARRWQVLALAACGFDAGRTADALGMTREVARNYRTSLRRRLQLDPRRPFADALWDRLHPLLAGAAPELSRLFRMVCRSAGVDEDRASRLATA